MLNSDAAFEYRKNYSNQSLANSFDLFKTLLFIFEKSSAVPGKKFDKRYVFSVLFAVYSSRKLDEQLQHDKSLTSVLPIMKWSHCIHCGEKS